MNAEALLPLALAALLYALVSGRGFGTWVSVSMAFTALGLLLGDIGLGWIELGVSSAALNDLAEITLVLMLFGDASAIDLRSLRRQHAVPLRLLGIGLPLTVLAGLACALVLLPDFGLLDAALGWTGFTLAQVLLGPAAGIGVGWTGARLADAAVARHRISQGFLRLSTIALPLVAYGGAELASGNGFLAAFACGLTVGTVSRPLRVGIEDFAEAEGELLTLFVFFALGAILLPATIPQMEWRHALYALLSLSVVRMVPVAICLAGLGLDRATIAFLGWFGPRGLASVIYLLLTDDYPLASRSDLYRGAEPFQCLVADADWRSRDGPSGHRESSSDGRSPRRRWATFGEVSDAAFLAVDSLGRTPNVVRPDELVSSRVASNVPPSRQHAAQRRGRVPSGGCRLHRRIRSRDRAERGGRHRAGRRIIP